METLRIAVACRNASGMSDMPIFRRTTTSASTTTRPRNWPKKPVTKALRLLR